MFSLPTLYYLWQSGGLSWSDWGSDEAYQTVEGAAEQAEEWIRTVAENKDWSAGELSYALTYVSDAEDTANSATTFWARLHTIWDLDDDDDLDGWDELSKVWASATGAAESEAESREAGSVSSVIGGTVTETASELDEEYNTPKAWLTLAAITAIGLFVFVKAAK